MFGHKFEARHAELSLQKAGIKALEAAAKEVEKLAKLHAKKTPNVTAIAKSEGTLQSLLTTAGHADAWVAYENAGKNAAAATGMVANIASEIGVRAGNVASLTDEVTKLARSVGIFSAPLKTYTKAAAHLLAEGPGAVAKGLSGGSGVFGKTARVAGKVITLPFKAVGNMVSRPGMAIPTLMVAAFGTYKLGEYGYNKHLEHKAESLQATNAQLANEVAALEAHVEASGPADGRGENEWRTRMAAAAARQNTQGASLA